MFLKNPPSGGVKTLRNHKELFSNDYFRVYEDVSIHSIRVVRSRKRFSNLDSAKQHIDELVDLVTPFGRQDYAMLFDSREGPGNSDPEFEKLAGQFQHQMQRSFKCFVVLLATVVGRMQVDRIAREQEATVVTFTDEYDALTYIAGRSA